MITVVVWYERDPLNPNIDMGGEEYHQFATRTSAKAFILALPRYAKYRIEGAD